MILYLSILKISLRNVVLPLNNNITSISNISDSIKFLLDESSIDFFALKSNFDMLIHILGEIEDPRKSNLNTYKLENILAISLILIMEGNFRSFNYAAAYIKINQERFIKLGLVEPNVTPSHDTLRRVFMLLDPQQLKEVIINKLEAFLKRILELNKSDKEIELYSIDGKEFRGSGRSNNTKNPKSNFNLFNVFNVSKDLCLSSNPLTNKESEILEAQRTLAKFNLKNKVITGDALHCQKETCRIITERKGKYLFTVKDNQSGLLAEIKAKLDKDSKKVNEIKYNDCTYRILLLTKAYAGYEFSEQKAYVYMLSNKRKNQTVNKQIERYFITSLKEPELITRVVDSRWKIENDLHKTKDMMFQEDEYTFTDSNAVKVMAVLNNIAYSFFRIASNFLNDYSMLECRIAYNSNPIEIISRIVPLLDSKNFKQLLKDNLKGKKSQ